MIRELDSRTDDGLEVSLLWDEETGAVMVQVDDRKTGVGGGVTEVPAGRALDAFRHPYLYLVPDLEIETIPEGHAGIPVDGDGTWVEHGTWAGGGVALYIRRSAGGLDAYRTCYGSMGMAVDAMCVLVQAGEVRRLVLTNDGPEDVILEWYR